jgi:PKD repeat protein
LFTSPGIYYTCLTVTDTSGYCTFCDTLTVAGLAPCDAQFANYAYNKNPDSIYFYPTGAAALSYYWSFGDGGVSTESSVWHTFKTVGSYYACLAVDDTGAYCFWCDTVRVTTLTGIPIVQTAQLDVAIYPNPMNEYTTISLHNTTNPVALQIYDLLGRSVYQMDNIRDGKYTINTKTFLSGLYYFTVTDNGRVVSGGKLIAVH